MLQRSRSLAWVLAVSAGLGFISLAALAKEDKGRTLKPPQGFSTRSSTFGRIAVVPRDSLAEPTRRSAGPRSGCGDALHVEEVARVGDALERMRAPV